MIELWLRRDYSEKPGGDLVLARHFERALNAAGADAGLLAIPRSPRLPGVGPVHIFNIDRYCEFAATGRSVLRSARPLVVSPIHHPREGVETFEWRVRRGPQRFLTSVVRTSAGRERLKHIVRNQTLRSVVEALRPRLMAELAAVIEQARVIIVQAPGEGVELEATFGQGAMRGVEWVPNGVTVDANLSTDGDRDIDVLVVGRIEERKNQLHVAQSLAGSDLKTMFVGGVNPRSRRYNTAFQSVVLRSSNLTYLPHVEMPVLRQLYCRSRILLGASHFEVVSLAELEAVAYGCQLVTGTSGYIADYLGGLATYLAPTAPPHQLLDTLERVSAAGVNHAGMQLVRSQYTWDRSAQILRDVYRRYGLL